MKTENPIFQSIFHPIRSWLALPVLALVLAAGSSNLGATDFGSLQDVSWFDPVNSPWNQPGSPYLGGTDLHGPEYGIGMRGMRGGSGFRDAYVAQCACRFWDQPTLSGGYPARENGFRCVVGR